MKGLTTLPYEVLLNIVVNVDFEDVVSLGKASRAFEFLRIEDSICKTVLQSKIPFSLEAQSATAAGGGYASALRAAAKRRESLATVSPFTVATVALGDAYLYCKGVLCYLLDDRIRILALHNSGRNETVINIPTLLTQALPFVGNNVKGVFRALYFSEDVLSCIYRTSSEDSDAWLITFNHKTQCILVTEELNSTDKIFVRHNNQYLYYGTHSELGTDGFKKWLIRGYDFTTRKWFPEKIRLHDLVGSEIGSTICFEFYQEYFYALSNQTSFEVEEIDWTSFYHCARFPLSSPCDALVQKTVDESMWRRQHQEGPIDDRWTSLRLDVDETSGDLKIVESRKEWYLGSSKSQITYYKTDIVFEEPCKHDEMEDLLFDPDLSILIPGALSAAPDSTSSAAISAAVLTTTATTISSPPKLHNHDLSSFPDDPLLRLLRPDDNPHHMCAQPRLPQNTHPGNDGSHQPTITLAKSRVRYYDTSASAYMDLIDDPDPTDWQGKQRLRLRAGSRKLKPPLRDESKLLRNYDDNLQIALKEMYSEQPIIYWPPAQNPDKPSADLDALYTLLNPPSHLGEVYGTADERSLVYATGGYDKPQAIIFVSFDPRIKLAGLKRWGGLERKGVGEGPHIDGRATGYVGAGEMYVDVQEADRTITMDRKGKEKAPCAPVTPVIDACGVAVVEVDFGDAEVGVREVHERSWAWTEKAMYLDIGSGFYFDYQKEGQKWKS